MSADPIVSGDNVMVAAAPEANEVVNQSNGAPAEQNVPLAALQQERSQRQMLQETSDDQRSSFPTSSQSSASSGKT